MSKNFMKKLAVTDRKYEKECGYWLNKLSGDIVKNNFPYDYRKTDFDQHKKGKAKVRFKLKGEIFSRLMALGNGSDYRLNMIMIAGLVLLLNKYTNNRDIIVGMPIYKQAVERNFTNTSLAIRNRLEGNMTFRELLLQVRQVVNEAIANQGYPIEILLEKLKLQVSENGFPLFDIAILFENIQDKKYIQHLYLDMFISFLRKDEYIEGVFEYHSSLYKKSTIQRIISHFENLLKKAVVKVDLQVSNLDILSEQEKQQLLFDFNVTDVEYPQGKTIHQLFGEQVKKYPHGIAVVCGDECVSYRILDEKANRVANYLYTGENIQEGELVGILGDRSIEQIAAILGILKVGGGYMPIEPSLPEERVREMIDDAGVGVVISQRKYIRILNRLQWECQSFHSFLCMDSMNLYTEEESEKSGLMDKRLWNYIGESATDEITGGGWLSSYTGEPLSKEEMNEYGENILKKLLPIIHKEMRVLEIGCASGISMYRIAPRVGFYYGTDLSNVILEKNKERIEAEGHQNISLSCLAAHEIDEIEEKDFDLIILNSVIQHFHGHNYLRKVIRKVIDLLSEKGYIFIGDVMDQDLKEALTREMVEFKLANRGKNFRTKTDWSAELFVSRLFFEDLSIDIPVISEVKFSDKIGTIENELTKFRYDVLIGVDKARMETVFNTVDCFRKPGREKYPTGSGGEICQTGWSIPPCNGIKKHRYQHDLMCLQRAGTGSVLSGVKAGNIAYVIYTSGTTGEPKGVLIDHRNVVRLMFNDSFMFDFRSADVWTMFHSYSFDFSVWEMYGALLYGGKLVLIPGMLSKDTGNFLKLLKREAVTVLNQTPSAFYALVNEELQYPMRGLSLRYVIFGGDALSPARLKEWREKYPGVKLINMYGITETTVHVTYKELTDKEIELDISSIGKPIPTLRTYILDRNLNPMPLGAAGELYVSGEGLGRGYLNDILLTIGRFSAGFGKGNQRLYRSGDLARFLEGGEIEYLGRIDRQVKIRGYRIEPGEIESQLLRHEDIKEAVVVLREEKGDRYLCAYIISEREIEVSELRGYLSSVIPEYMVPAFFIPVESIPLTANGKIAKNRLPLPEVESFAREFIGAEDSVKKRLIEIWSDILEIEKHRIGLDANFFELGGHSLKATILVSLIRKEFDVEFPISEVFSGPTVKEMAGFIKKSKKSIYEEIKPIEKREYYLQSSAQKRLFFLGKLDQIDISYNMPYILKIQGDSNKQWLEETLRKLLDRHEVLRTSFHLIDNKPAQRIHDRVDSEIEEVQIDKKDIEEEDTKEIIKKFIRSFDLSKAPLLRVGLAELSGGEYLLQFDMHHIIGDGTSIGILIEDFVGTISGEEPVQLKIQYKDFSGWQNNLIETGRIKKQEDFWLNLYSGKIPRLDLSGDFPRPDILSFTGETCTFRLDPEHSLRLRELGEKYEATIFMSLMAAFYVLLFKYTGQNDIIVGTGIMGRPHADLQNIVGMFVNSLAIRARIDMESCFLDFLKEVRFNCLNVFENQDLQFEILVDKLGLKRDPSRNPLFDVLLIVQNFRKSEFRMKDGKAALYQSGNLTTKFDLAIIAHEIQEELFFKIQYSTKLFKRSTIEEMANNYMRIIKQVIHNKFIKLKDIEISSDLIQIKTHIPEAALTDFSF